MILRSGKNARETIAAVKTKLTELKRSLPPGVEVVTTYDRSQLIDRAIANLTQKLLEEFVVVALVCGLFVSTALTLIMVPTMITAPSVIWQQMRGTGHNMARLFGWMSSPFRRRREVVEGAVPEGAAAAEIPADADSAKKYIRRDGNGLVETEKDGVTIVSRPEAAE